MNPNTLDRLVFHIAVFGFIALVLLTLPCYERLA